MFGYITVNRPELKVKDLELYRSCYCGVCDELCRSYGRRGQILLSYDCTFLAILLTGLYEPGETVRLRRCLVHPAVKHRETKSVCSSYAADMNVLLSYMKALDDWQDEKKERARLLAHMLHGDYLKIREHYPRQERAVRRNIRLLSAEEKKETGQLSREELLSRLDRVAGCSGRLLGEICVYKEDIWARDLRELGFYLGKFIYLMDAYDDLEKDKKSGCFNILLPLLESDPDTFEETVKSLLLDMAACCCRAFERLPIVKDVDILRNVLYSGIWVRYNQVRKSRSKSSKEEDHERSI